MRERQLVEDSLLKRYQPWQLAASFCNTSLNPLPHPGCRPGSAMWEEEPGHGSHTERMPTALCLIVNHKWEKKRPKSNAHTEVLIIAMIDELCTWIQKNDLCMINTSSPSCGFYPKSLKNVLLVMEGPSRWGRRKTGGMGRIANWLGPQWLTSIFSQQMLARVVSKKPGMSVNQGPKFLFIGSFGISCRNRPSIEKQEI